MHKKILQGVCLLLFLGICTPACVNRHEDSLAELYLLYRSLENKTILIIGDSLTFNSNGFSLEKEMGTEYLVFWKGVRGYDFTNWSPILDEAFAAAPQTPGFILVPLGTNDGYRFTGPTFSANVDKFHKELRQRSSARVVYFQMPRTNDTSLRPNIISNNATLAANLPADNTELVDVDTVFQNALPLPLLYPVDDQVHPNENGYSLIATEMKKAILE